MASNPGQKDRYATLKMTLSIASLIGVVIYCWFHPGEWWKILLKVIFSPL